MVAAVGREKYSLRWTAMLTPPATGEYDLTVRTGMWNRTATARLFLDDKELDFGTGPSTQMTSTQPAAGTSAAAARPGPVGGRPEVRLACRVPAAGCRRHGSTRLDSARRRRPRRGRDAREGFRRRDRLRRFELRARRGRDAGREHPRLPGRRPHQPGPAGAAGEPGEGGHRHRQAGGRRPDQRQRHRGELRGGARRGARRGMVRRRGGRHGHRGDPGRRQQPGGPSSGDVLQERGSAAPVHGLRHEGPHLPVLQGRAAVPVRLRVELFDLRVFGPHREADAEGRRDPRDGQEHVGPRRRRGGSALRRRRPGGGSADTEPARIPADPPACGREPRGDASRSASDDLPKSAVEVSVGGGQPAANIPHVRGTL